MYQGVNVEQPADTMVCGAFTVGRPGHPGREAQKTKTKGDKFGEEMDRIA